MRTSTKRSMQSAQMQARYALASASERMDARDFAGVVSILEPTLKTLQEIDEYNHLQSILCVQLATSHALLNDFNKAEYRLQMAYMLCCDAGLEKVILELRDEIFG